MGAMEQISGSRENAPVLLIVGLSQSKTRDKYMNLGDIEVDISNPLPVKNIHLI